jgi:serine/threonine protein kinase
VQRQRDDDNNAAVAAVDYDTLDGASKDLLNRLLEKNPQYRLKSVMALERIAFFHNFSMDDVRHKKVRKKVLFRTSTYLLRFFSPRIFI